MTARRVVGLLLVAVGMSYAGWSAAGVTPKTTTAERTTTHLVVKHRTRLVTIHVKGHILSRHDHILVVYVPRAVFHTRGANPRRVVIPAHQVKIHEPSPVFGVTSAVIGVSPLPVTITVPIDVPIPGPTVTVPGPTTTLPQATTTVTVPTTITLPLSGD